MSAPLAELPSNVPRADAVRALTEALQPWPHDCNDVSQMMHVAAVRVRRLRAIDNAFPCVLYRHIKSGDHYLRLHPDANIRMEGNLDDVAVYQDLDNPKVIWIRPLKEFDQKFEAVKEGAVDEQPFDTAWRRDYERTETEMERQARREAFLDALDAYIGKGKKA